VGADLSPNRLIQAYRQGIFPWFSQGQPILWWSPTIRACIDPSHAHISRSMAKFIQKTTLTVTLNHAFPDVMDACSQRGACEGTWITHEMKQAYLALHQLGRAHSIEVWDETCLVGGLYGVSVGAVFCGESMFHRQTNASKLAFIHLCHHFHRLGGRVIDAQLPTPHLASLGVTPCHRTVFINQLLQYRDDELPEAGWHPRRLA
jgi:leucyl/phenylalanyl-tRNA--protein transferase